MCFTSACEVTWSRARMSFDWISGAASEVSLSLPETLGPDMPAVEAQPARSSATSDVLHGAATYHGSASSAQALTWAPAASADSRKAR
jgi:hypothetical protein